MGLTLHLPTVLVVTCVMLVTLGSFFFATDRGAKRTGMGTWLGVICFLGAIGTVCVGLRGFVPDWVSIWFGNLALVGGLGFYCTTLLRFDGRNVPIWIALIGPLAWTAACLIPNFYGVISYRIGLLSIISIAYCAVTARSLALARQKDPLPSRTFGAWLNGVHACVQVGRIMAVSLDPFTIMPGHSLGTWGTILVLESLGFLLGLIVVLPALERERAELRHRRDARTDSLTGIANRRSFVAAAEERVDRDLKTAALMLFDLDHFKRVNDTYGHAAGDRALIAFGALLRKHMPADSIFGRIGGEEFACLLASANADEAAHLAETIRRATMDLGMTIAGRPVTMTVSIGVATTRDVGYRFQRLHGAADGALYEAKRAGRNRTQTQVGPVPAIGLHAAE